MRIYNSYILTVSLMLLLTTIVMVALGLNALENYYTAYIIEALVVTELYIHLDVKARQGLTFTSTILFVGFLMALCLQVIRIIR